jgi:hypothetical protein
MRISIARIIVFLSLLVFPGILAAQQLASEKDLLAIAQQEDLPAEKQSQFAKVYAELGPAIKAYQGAIQAGGPPEPMFREASLRLVEAVRQYNKAVQKLTAKELFILQHYPELVEDYKRWSMLCRTRYSESAMIKSFAEDESLRPYFTWSNHFVLTSRSRDQHPKNLRPFLPESTMELTPEEALELSLKFANQAPDKERLQQLKNLERKLAKLELPEKEIEDWTRTMAIKSLYEGYTFVNRPEPVKAAQKKIVDLNFQLSEIWPGWGKANEQVLQSKPK